MEHSFDVLAASTADTLGNVTIELEWEDEPELHTTGVSSRTRVIALFDPPCDDQMEQEGFTLFARLLQDLAEVGSIVDRVVLHANWSLGNERFPGDMVWAQFEREDQDDFARRGTFLLGTPRSRKRRRCGSGTLAAGVPDQLRYNGWEKPKGSGNDYWYRSIDVATEVRQFFYHYVAQQMLNGYSIVRPNARAHLVAVEWWNLHDVIFGPTMPWSLCHSFECAIDAPTVMATRIIYRPD